jgi:ELWxxDGT repeat protein
MTSHLRRHFALCLLLCIPAVPALAETAETADTADGPARLVADLAPGSELRSPYLSGIASIGNKSVFLRVDNEYQPALWVTDGTPEGTSALAVLCPFCENATLLGSTGSVAFYQVRQSGPDPRMQIWRTDGTKAGTFPVELGTGYPLPSSIDGGRLFFTACTPAQGCEVWSSDGTVAGTGLVGEAAPGPANGDIRQIVGAGGSGDKAFLIVGGSSLWIADRSGVSRLSSTPKIRFLFAGGGRAFFVADTQSGGLEVWTSDGTAAGTRPVTRFAAKNPFGQSSPFTVLVEGRLYFAARNARATANDLWSVGAKPESLRRLTDFHDPSAYFSAVRKSGNRILFVVQRMEQQQFGPPKLWASGGDLRSTAPLSGCAGGCPTVESGLAPLGQGRFVFKGHNPAGEALWVTDGTGAGTRRLQSTGRFHDLTQYVALGDRVLFELTNEYETGELWVTDGTVAGTFFTAPGGPSWSHYYGWGGPLLAGKANGLLLFGAIPDQDNPYEALMTSDGTPGGMRELARFVVGNSSNPQQLLPLGDRLLVQVCTASEQGSTQEMLAVRGTETATLLSRHIDSSCGVESLSYRLATLGGRVAFVLNENSVGSSLWVTDGTPAGTIALIPAAAPEEPIDVVRFGDRFAVWLVVPNGASGWNPQLWVSDGTSAGTGRLLDLPAGTDMLDMTVSGGKLYFFDFEQAANGKYRMHPWVTDGTAAGTHVLTAVNGTSPEERFIEAAGRVFFRFTPEGGKTEIWSTDGTAAGTGPAVTPDAGMLDPQGLTGAGGRLYFQARRVPKGPLLPWASDGTDAGTMPLADVEIEDLGDLYYLPGVRPGFTEVGGRVYFSASDPAHGDELWSTDGTPEGTARVKDITPGPLGSYPRNLVAWNGRLWFRARDIAHGMELWTSDGTAEGTRLVQDLSPGPSWSTPRELTAAGGSLYFSDHDGEHGRELWELPAVEADTP